LSTSLELVSVYNNAVFKNSPGLFWFGFVDVGGELPSLTRLLIEIPIRWSRNKSKHQVYTVIVDLYASIINCCKVADSLKEILSLFKQII